MDSSLPGSTVCGILQARILEWVAMLSSRESSRHRDGTLHWQGDSLPLSHQGSPRILEWVAYPFSRWSSWSRNWTRLSYIAGRFFTSWVTREAHYTTTVVTKYVCVLSHFLSCLTLSDPMDCRSPGSSVHGILQARILEWVAMPSSRVTNYNC